MDHIKSLTLSTNLDKPDLWKPTKEPYSFLENYYITWCCNVLWTDGGETARFRFEEKYLWQHVHYHFTEANTSIYDKWKFQYQSLKFNDFPGLSPTSNTFEACNFHQHKSPKQRILRKPRKFQAFNSRTF